MGCPGVRARGRAHGMPSLGGCRVQNSAPEPGFPTSSGFSWRKGVPEAALLIPHSLEEHGKAGSRLQRALGGPAALRSHGPAGTGFAGEQSASLPCISTSQRFPIPPWASPTHRSHSDVSINLFLVTPPPGPRAAWVSLPSTLHAGPAAGGGPWIPAQ